MLGWWICIINSTPERADKLLGRKARAPFVLADWETGVGGLEWVRKLLKDGKATQLKNGAYPNRYTAKACDVLPLITDDGVKNADNGVWVFGMDDGEEYALPPGWSENPNLREDNIRKCPPEAVLTIDAWDLS
jgi:hypothetical protein